MSGLSDKQLRAMSNIMRGQYRNKQTGAIQIPSSLGISVDKARKMRRLMNAVYSELEQAYISRGATPPEKLVDYFPQVYVNSTVRYTDLMRDCTYVLLRGRLYKTR